MCPVSPGSPLSPCSPGGPWVYMGKKIIKQSSSPPTNNTGEIGTCKKLTLSPWGPVGPFAMLSSPCSPYASNIVTEKNNQWHFPLNPIVCAKINGCFV